MPTALVLLLATVLLTSHIPPAVCRPRGRGDDKSRLDEVLLTAGDNAVSSYLIAEKMLRNLQSNPRLQEELFVPPFLFEGVMTPLGSGGVGHRARSSLKREERPPGEEEDNGNHLEELVELSKRSDPHLSIDLTFHLLRNMIEMARIESQREQAVLNRKYLDEAGK